VVKNKRSVRRHLDRSRGAFDTSFLLLRPTGLVEENLEGAVIMPSRPRRLTCVSENESGLQ
jgi:hypothetical protein